MNKIKKVVFVFAAALVLVVPILSANALSLDDLTGSYDVSAGLGEKDPRDIASNIIKIALAFLGILAVVIILVGGFKWMTAMGNEDQITSARGIIIAGIISLVIVLAAWGIANFVLNSLIGATT